MQKDIKALYLPRMDASTHSHGPHTPYTPHTPHQSRLSNADVAISPVSPREVKYLNYLYISSSHSIVCHVLNFLRDLSLQSKEFVWKDHRSSYTRVQESSALEIAAEQMRMWSTYDAGELVSTSR